MSDRYQEFDQIFRDRLRDQTVTPPDSVWNNIQAERTFGHIVANKISSSWRIIGTLLLLAMAGGTSALLMSQGEENLPHAEDILLTTSNTKEISENNTGQVVNRAYDFEDHTIDPLKAIELAPYIPEEIEEENPLTNGSDLLASNSSMGFGIPNFGDSRLGILVEEMDGWGTAKAASAIRFYHLNGMYPREMDGIKLVKSPMIPEGKWDYVMEAAPEKSFMERLSVQFYVGPQFINKILTPKYNMETEFLEKRLKTENTRLAYTMGASFQYDLKKNKFFETGLQLTQIYEEVRIDGDRRFSNQYDFFEIPFLIGYQDRESKWGWFLKGGLGVQVYNNYKGYILKRVEDRIANKVPSQPEPGAEFRISGSNVVKNIVNDNHTISSDQDRSEVYDLSSDENPYKKNGIINVHAAAGVTYFHSIKTSFSLTPYYRQSVNTLTKEDAEFNERISYMGILFGTQIKF